MNRILALIIAMAFTASQPSYAKKEDPDSPFKFYAPYAELLKEYTSPLSREGIETTAVNYRKWAQDPRHAEAMALLKSANTEKLDTKEKELSFWINTFNLLVIDLITKESETGSIQNLGGIVGDPWNEFSWEINGKAVTLQYISAQMISPKGEPRAFFALSRAALSAPSLKDTPYTPDYIYTQLENQTKRFMANREKSIKIIKGDKNSRLRQKDRAVISPIFEWHKMHFDNGNLHRYIRRYFPLGYNIELDEYMAFNWTLNSVATPTKKKLEALVE